MNQPEGSTKPLLAILAPLESAERPPTRYAPDASAALAYAGLIAMARDFHELLKKTRDKYQGAREPLVREHAQFFTTASEANAALISEGEKETLTKTRATDLAEKLHGALISLCNRPPQGTWFADNCTYLERARIVLESVVREQLSLDLRLRSHLHRPEPSRRCTATLVSV